MILITTSKGDIYLQLDKEEAPKTVENFLNYVRSGFYNNTLFHRVIDRFMIQGGGFNADMTQKSTMASIENEAKSAKANKRGTIAMARTTDPHSATSQFFINLVDNAFLNFKKEDSQGYGYCVFGTVIKGMDVVDAIGKARTGQRMGHADVPLEDIIIHEIREIMNEST